MVRERRKRNVVIGAGYLGLRVAKAWQSQGVDVHLTTRSDARAEELQAMGFSVHPLDITEPDTLEKLPDCDSLLLAVGFDRAADNSRREVYVDGMNHLLTRGPEVAHRWIYISSTGVYGNSDGEWVDESTLCEPASEGGQCCLEAEHDLLASREADRAVILRLAGIYGPGRIPFMNKIEQHEPIPVAPHGFLNLIHVDDAVRAVLAVEEAPGDCPVRMNVSDGHPVLRRDYYQHLAELTGGKAVFSEPPAGSTRADRAKSSKRIRNSVYTQFAGDHRLHFKNYRDGLKASLTEQRTV